MAQFSADTISLMQITQPIDSTVQPGGGFFSFAWGKE